MQILNENFEQLPSVCLEQQTGNIISRTTGVFIGRHIFLPRRSIDVIDTIDRRGDERQLDES